MADELLFDDLISSIQNAFLKANMLVQSQHLEMLGQFFDKDGNPEMIKVTLPSLVPGEDVKTVYLPKICLVPVNGLKMQEFSVKFSVEFSQLQTQTKNQKTEDPKSNTAAGEEKRKSFFDFLHREDNKESALLARHAKGKDSDTTTADVEIKFVGTDPPEGVLRINNYLIRCLP